jgi:hypothetical protein
MLGPGFKVSFPLDGRRKPAKAKLGRSPNASKIRQERRSLRMANKTAVRIILVLGLLVLSQGIVSAQPTTPPPQTFSTTIYFDYTNSLSKGGPVTSAGKNSFFAFRRAYFTYENKINDNLKFRFRFDADNTANLGRYQDGFHEEGRQVPALHEASLSRVFRPSAEFHHPSRHDGDYSIQDRRGSVGLPERR